MKQFSKIDLIKQAWEILKKNVKLVAMLIGAFIVYQIAQSIIQGVVGNGPFLSLVSLGFSVLSLFLEIGAIKIILKLVDGKKADIKELWAYPQYLLRMIGASIIYCLILVLGFILLIIPGIYLAIRLQFYSYYIIDKDAGAIDSLKMSWKATEKNVINLFLFALLLIGINILGAIALGVGLLVTVPVSFIAVTLLYRKLSA